MLRAPARRLFVRAGLALAAVALMTACVEAALWAAGAPLGWRLMSDDGWAVDDFEARYRLKPGKRHEFDMDYQANALGLRGPLPDRPVVLSLGDSCTFGVNVEEKEAYPFLLAPGRGRVVDAAVPGWSTFNALRWFETERAADWKPKLVTLYFGWNDAEKAFLTESAFYDARRLSARSRAAAAIVRLQQSVWRRDGLWAWSGLIARVPVGDFEKNIEAMADGARSLGAVPVLITPAYPPAWRGPRRADIERYAAAVRDVARRRGYALVDLAAEVAGMPKAQAADLFVDPPAHLSARGHRLLALRLKPWLEKNGDRRVSGRP
jgi:lysophospholipase L1-like esterase